MSRDRFILLAPEDSPATWAVKVTDDDTEGRFTLAEGRGSIQITLDDARDEFVYVLEGELDARCDGRTHRLTAGMCALLPHGLVRDVSGTRAHLLRLSWPGTTDSRYVLGKSQARPGRIKVPPAFAAKARTTDTGGTLSVMETLVVNEIPRHIHHKADEGVYVLDGELTVEFDGETHTAAKGQFVLLPHGVRHALRPGSTPPPRVIQISAPGGWECFIEDLIEAGARSGTGGRLEPARLNPIAAKYDITYDEA
ncbi:cupin domain-containing protein [Microbispora sp. NPDC049125]|uniref:cupin domain-containing protein n=1 Tax=Microbispora sp. NPDC049125 TaxID=3154929 RepID=UPI003465AE69